MDTRFHPLSSLREIWHPALAPALYPFCFDILIEHHAITSPFPKPAPNVFPSDRIIPKSWFFGPNGTLEAYEYRIVLSTPEKDATADIGADATFATETHDILLKHNLLRILGLGALGGQGYRNTDTVRFEEGGRGGGIARWWQSGARGRIETAGILRLRQLSPGPHALLRASTISACRISTFPNNWKKILLAYNYSVRTSTRFVTSVQKFRISSRNVLMICNTKPWGSTGKLVGEGEKLARLTEIN
ncbi:MAG: hypothetical protein L6R42_008847 [Xanthoria sp. 1 TBL-2021]|nr:MAG: hypothetical protein L6R42_008847 [Xanthoria sp. 1 TBL-2021]